MLLHTQTCKVFSVAYEVYWKHKILLEGNECFNSLYSERLLTDEIVRKYKLFLLPICLPSEALKVASFSVYQSLCLSGGSAYCSIPVSRPRRLAEHSRSEVRRAQVHISKRWSAILPAAFRAFPQSVQSSSWIIIICDATGSDEPGPAERPPLAVFPDCTTRYWVDMWSAHRIPQLHVQLYKPDRYFFIQVTTQFIRSRG
jgi:hypothetical protein